MEHIQEYTTQVNNFFEILMAYSNIVCGYQYFNDHVLSGTSDYLKNIEKKIEKSININELQNTLSSTNNLPNNKIEASILVYLYIQKLIEEKSGSPDNELIFIGLRLKKHNVDLLSHVCKVKENREQAFALLSEFASQNEDLEIILITE